MLAYTKSQLLYTIYDDFLMEFYLSHLVKDAEGNITMLDLTDEDKAFAVEVFESIWTEDIKYPDYDTLFTVHVDKQWLSDMGLVGLTDMADLLNRFTFKVHVADGEGKFALVSEDKEVANLVLTSKEDGVYLLSNLFGDKAFRFSYEAIAEKLAASASSKKAVTVGTIDIGEKTISLIDEIMPQLLTVNEEGTSYTFTLSAENTEKLVNALSEDLIATNSIENKLRGKMLVAFITSTLPKGNVITSNVTLNDTGFSMKSEFNWVDIFDDQSKTITSEAVLTSTDEGVFSNGTVIMPDSSDYTFDFKAVLEQINLEMVYEIDVDGKKVPVYRFTFASDKSNDNEVNVSIDDLTFSRIDENGEMKALWTLTGMYNTTDSSTINGAVLSWDGYEEPVITFASNKSFCFESKVVIPNNVIDFENLTDDMMTNLVNEVMENIDRIFLSGGKN